MIFDVACKKCGYEAEVVTKGFERPGPCALCGDELEVLPAAPADRTMPLKKECGTNE
jgi:hypothetical protein